MSESIQVKELNKKLFPSGFEGKSYSEIANIFIKSKNDIEAFVESCEAGDKVKGKLNKLIQACEKEDDIKIFHRMKEVASLIEVDNKVRKNKDFIEFSENLKKANEIWKKSVDDQSKLNGGLIGFIDALKRIRVALFTEKKGVTPADWRKIDKKAISSAIRDLHNSTDRNKDFLDAGKFNKRWFNNFAGGIGRLAEGVKGNSELEDMESCFKKIKDSCSSLDSHFKELKKEAKGNTDKLLTTSIKWIERIMSYTKDSEKNWKAIDDSSKTEGRANNGVEEIWNSVANTIENIAVTIDEVNRRDHFDNLIGSFKPEKISMLGGILSNLKNKKDTPTPEWLEYVKSFGKDVSSVAKSSKNEMEFASKLSPSLKEFRISIQDNNGLREWISILDTISDAFNNINGTSEERKERYERIAKRRTK